MNSDEIIAYASVLKLSRGDVHTLKIKDAYALHKVVYGLFDDIRSDTEKQSNVPSGIVYVDKGGDFHNRQILMLSNRKPHQTPQFGHVETKTVHSNFLMHDRYAFEITINPSTCNRAGKIMPVRGRDAIASWFSDKSLKSCGFLVNAESLDIKNMGVQVFEVAERTVTHGRATIMGELIVNDRDRFIKSFQSGIGRGRAFGFGLLQIAPL